MAVGDVVDIGVGPPQSRVTVTVELTNYSATSVRVVGSQSSCSCVAATELPAVIPPGQARPFEVAVIRKGTPGRFAQQLLFYTDDGRRGAVAVQVHGLIREPLPGQPLASAGTGPAGGAVASQESRP